MFGIPTEFIFGTATTLLSWWMERDSRKLDSDERAHELAIKKLEKEIAEMENATKRAPSWLRLLIIVPVLGSVFGGLLYYASQADIPITYVYEVPQKVFLGLFKWGKTVKTLELDGFPIMPFITHSIAQIMGFTFGRTLARRN